MDKKYRVGEEVDVSTPVDLSLGDLEGVFEIVDGCNGLYVYHLETEECKGAGDGSETTLADLASFARTDPVGFAEAYGPGPAWRLCDVCNKWRDVYPNNFHCVGIGHPPKGKWVCEECYAGLVAVAPPDGPPRIFASEEDAAKYSPCQAYPYPTRNVWRDAYLETGQDRDKFDATFFV